MRVLHSFGAAAAGESYTRATCKVLLHRAHVIPSTHSAAIFALTGTNAAPSPNFEVSKTTVSVDRHRELLDNGQVIVRVQR